MFKGLRTVIYQVDDIQAGKTWYSSALGFGPYFDEPFYVGFDVGGFELGLLPKEDALPRGQNVYSYWGVDDAQAALEKLLSLGATLHSAPSDVGEGIIVCTVLDPWQNVFGFIVNPHFGKS